METSEILILGKDEIGGQILKDRFGGHAFKIIETLDQSEAFQIVKKHPPAIVIITSVANDNKDGLHSVRQIRRINGTIPIIMISHHSSEDRVISAFRAGVNDYFNVPFQCEDVMERIRKCLNGHSLPPSCGFKRNGSARPSNREMIGDSKPMREIRSYLQQVAATDTTVLITGETGTGKELAAELIHKYSSRYQRPFVSVNCAALPETLVESELFGYDRGAFTGALATKQGKFELAAGGSVFLDEIGDMSAFSQAKILRIIENKMIIRLGGKKDIPLKVRIIAATNKDPEQLVSLGKFREDLYYRLNVVRVHLPPLRERKEDILDLADYIIETLNRRYNLDIQGLTEAALAALMRYDWPGNVRELINLFEAVYVNPPQKQIDFSNLPRQFRRKLRKNDSTTDNEREYIVSALISTNWKKAEAASKLNWSRMTLYRKIIKYNIVEHRNPPR
ncbi:MAG: sigma-54-dependent Fis family transcriptional regulator [Desulfobacterales bacterium]|nr:MAG: sigma-54-dependent Fis family transcriptional regulator [Desulfobacterales bacterium]